MRELLNLFYRIYPLVIAALLAAGAIWLERATRSPEPTAEVAPSQTPDFIARTVHIVGFAKDGKLYYTLESPYLVHLSSTDSTRIERPELHLFTQGRRMQINADHGEVGPKGERVDFTDNVEAEREGDSHDPPLHLSSQQLTVWPQEQRAVSNVPVRITQGETRASANKLEADSVFGEMKLSGKVRMHLPHTKRNP